jgi:hypothetical protein
MNNQHMLIVSCTIIVLVLAFAKLTAQDLNGSSDSLSIQQQEQEEWRIIIELYNRGLDEYQKEKRKNKRHRHSEMVFRDAADKLTSYIDRHIKDINSLKYLRATFRLGTFWEYANKDEKAFDLYMSCANHPLINDARSLFDNQRLTSLVQTRLEKVSRRLNRLGANSSQPSGKHVIRKSGRGGSKGIPGEKNLPSTFKDLEP